jgi:hypothetical protein
MIANGYLKMQKLMLLQRRWLVQINQVDTATRSSELNEPQELGPTRLWGCVRHRTCASDYQDSLMTAEVFQDCNSTEIKLVSCSLLISTDLRSRSSNPWPVLRFISAHHKSNAKLSAS